MDTASQDFLDALKAFHKYGVKYLIVGGFAVNKYGYKRTTGDLDIYLKDTKENREFLIEALQDLKYGYFPELRRLPIIAGYCEIYIGHGMYMDLMSDIPGLEKDRFDEYYNEALVDIVQDFEVRYLHYNRLIENKKATARNKDLLDVEELQKINNQP